jgi:hypothetical protein
MAPLFSHQHENIDQKLGSSEKKIEILKEEEEK